MKIQQSGKDKSSAEKTDRAYRFLSNRTVGVVATAHEDGTPHAAAVYYSIDKSLNITFITKRHTAKSSNLDRDDRAAFVVFDEAQQSTVQMEVRAEEITDPKESHEAFMRALRFSLQTGESAIPPVARLSGDYVAYRLVPVRVNISAYRRRLSDKQGDKFETMDREDLG